MDKALSLGLRQVEWRAALLEKLSGRRSAATLVRGFPVAVAFPFIVTKHHRGGKRLLWWDTVVTANERRSLSTVALSDILFASARLVSTSPLK